LALGCVSWLAIATGYASAARDHPMAAFSASAPGKGDEIGVALVVAVDGSFGLNGATFRVLHAYVSPFRGLRVPARFSLLAGMTLAILAGYGATRLLERWPRARVALTGVVLILVIVEALGHVRETGVQTPVRI